jgi:hypothetical protein
MAIKLTAMKQVIADAPDVSEELMRSGTGFGRISPFQFPSSADHLELWRVVEDKAHSITQLTFVLLLEQRR